MELTILETGSTYVRAGYACPCGCTPSVAYERDAEPAEEGCCCGNHFAVGPGAGATLRPTEGFHPELQTFHAPWGETLEAAWSIGPSVHGPTGHTHDPAEDGGASLATDPVCGMSVDPAFAETKGLQSTYQGVLYGFCGKDCKLDFDENPERHLDPGYVPSM